MNNYKEVYKRQFGIRNGKSTYKVVIIADTEEDVPDVQEDWAPMSICYIADSGDCKVLNTQGVWCDV